MRNLYHIGNLFARSSDRSAFDIQSMVPRRYLCHKHHKKALEHTLDCSVYHICTTYQNALPFSNVELVLKLELELELKLKLQR